MDDLLLLNNVMMKKDEIANSKDEIANNKDEIAIMFMERKYLVN